MHNQKAESQASQTSDLSNSFNTTKTARVPHLRDGFIVGKVGNRASDPLSSPCPAYVALVILLLTATLTTQAQWDIQESHTTASLRGIHNVGGGVAWASGTNGTVLRTEDGGYLWQTCATPPGAEKLDFRGIQAFDENTAIVMSSGKGDLSRLYKTTDGCHTWKLLFTNPDPEGFWDALSITTYKLVGTDRSEVKYRLTVLGDPTQHLFTLFTIDLDDPTEIQPKISYDNTSLKPQLHLAGPGPDIGSTKLSDLTKYGRAHDPTPIEGESSFAASNSAYFDENGEVFIFVTGGPLGARSIVFGCDPTPNGYIHCGQWVRRLPLAHGESAGSFSIAGKRIEANRWLRTQRVFVTVGGDYLRPNDRSGTAAYTRDGGNRWQPAQTPPHGYRSAVAYDPKTKTWITVGPNGTDISRDDGRNWSPLKPGPLDQPDADKNWNALSLPFVVGPKGRIGKLRDNAIPTEASSKKEK
jgi:hypothetical protein